MVIMSTQQALMFINLVRRDETVRLAMISRQDEFGLDDVIALGSAQGLSFDISHLREAFRHDWALRALRGKGGGRAPAG